MCGLDDEEREIGGGGCTRVRDKEKVKYKEEY